MTQQEMLYVFLPLAAVFEVVFGVATSLWNPSQKSIPKLAIKARRKKTKAAIPNFSATVVGWGNRNVGERLWLKITANYDYQLKRQHSFLSLCMKTFLVSDSNMHGRTGTRNVNVKLKFDIFEILLQTSYLYTHPGNTKQHSLYLESCSCTTRSQC